jgi:hypothetical protein
VAPLLRPNLDRHAGIFGPFPLVRIGFDGSAHVRKAGFVVQLYRPKSDIVSYAIWEFNKTVVALASASWVANSVSYIVGGSFFFSHSLQFRPRPLKRVSGAFISRGYRTGSLCAIEHTVNTRISIFSTFITDLVLLTLMLVGVLRWRKVRMAGGILSLMYTQASVRHLTLILLMLTDSGIGYCLACNFHTCRSAPSGTFLHSSDTFGVNIQRWPPGFHYLESERCVTLLSTARL